MTGGQVGLALGGDEFGTGVDGHADWPRRLPAGRRPLPVIRATESEVIRHQAKVAVLDEAAGGESLWRKMEGLF
jgi:DNA polymerase-3 subunit epsilon